MRKTSFSKKLISVFLAAVMLVSAFSMGFGGMVAVAREQGISGGAEGFIPFKIYQREAVTGTTNVNTALVVQVTDANYQLKINSIAVASAMDNFSLNVAYTSGTVLKASNGATQFSVTGTIANTVNSPARYELTYDLLGADGEVVWKNLTAYTYGTISAYADLANGKYGTPEGKPGVYYTQDSNSLTREFDTFQFAPAYYINVPSDTLAYRSYTHRTVAWGGDDSMYITPMTIGGTGLATLSYSSIEFPGMKWIGSGALNNYLDGTWMSFTDPGVSGYWEWSYDIAGDTTPHDDTNYVGSTSYYMRKDADKANAKALVEDIVGANSDITDGFYVQKHHYTDESWNAFMVRLNEAAQVAYAAQSQSSGYRQACELATNAYNNLRTAFANLVVEHDFNHSSEVVTVSPLCTADGESETKCLCGITQTHVIPALGHEYTGEVTEPKCLDQGYTTYTCTRRGCADTYIADYTDSKGHTPEATFGWDATCTEAGMTGGVVCAECGAMLDDPKFIPALGHTAGEWETVTAATCTEDGFKIQNCAVCGEKLNEGVIPALGHAAGEWETVTDATCTEDGYKVQNCTVCAEKINDEVILALGHNYSVNVTPANCTEKGYSTYTCATCGDVYVDDYIDALGHVQGRVEVVDKPETNETLITKYCAICDAVITADTVAKDDFKVSGTIQSNGKTVLTGVVESDYSASVTIPHGALINVGAVTGTLTMSNVASLGVTGTKTYEKTLVTGIEKIVELDNYLPEFNSAAIVGKIDGVAYGYNLTGSDTAENYTINAVPQDVEAVRAAWAALSSHVAVVEVSADDSYASIPGTAYIQIGTEKLSFEDVNDTLKLDNITSGSGITATIKSAVKLEEVEELEDAQAKIFLPKGTVIAVGQTVATLEDDATIRIYGYEESAEINTILSTLRDCTSTEEVIKTAVLFLADLATAVDGQVITVDVEFDHIASGEWVVLEDATCTEDGCQVQYCVMCGEVVLEEAISATGHTDGEWVNTTLPKCAELGEDTLYCAVCGDAIATREVEALGHVEEIIPGVEPTYTTNGLTEGKKCTVCGEITVEQEIIPSLGVTVSGIVETFDDGIENDDTTTIELYAENSDVPAYTIAVEGTGKVEYAVDAVVPGTYTVKVSKANHATREYIIEVGTEAVSQDMKIHLLGDIDGDGTVRMNDLSRVNAHVKENTLLTGYALACADVTVDGDVRMNDMSRINAHVKETTYLWK